MDEVEIDPLDKSALVANLTGQAEESDVLRGDEQAERAKLFAVLEEAGNGSLLRGWRKELDPDGSLDVTFLEFADAAKKLGIQNVDVKLLFGYDSLDTLTLSELSGVHGDLVNRFKGWMKHRFGGPIETFVALQDHAGAETLGLQEFRSSCSALGFVERGPNELGEMFHFLDYWDDGDIELEDILFLEQDDELRRGALIKSRWKMLNQARNKILLEAYETDVNADLPSAHRLSQRKWFKAVLEKMPEINQLKQKDWRHTKLTRSMTSLARFRQYMVKMFGNSVRAWRTSLDTRRQYVITRAQMSAWCIKQVGLRVDFNALWQALDLDKDGSIRLEEVGTTHAAALAVFQRWVKEKWPSCEALWDHFAELAEEPSLADLPEMKFLSRESKRNYNSSLRYSVFNRMIEVLGWPGEYSKVSDTQHLCRALDASGCGFISRSDLHWLDGWKAPNWLSAVPDVDAWEGLRSILHQKCNHPLRAWRDYFDLDDSGLVVWSEFKEACRRLHFTGDWEGAWRYLDPDASGTITLGEFDEVSSEMLSSFKAFVESKWGCVDYALKTLDTDGSGALTLTELKRACRKHGWDGNVEKLFECLHVKTSRKGSVVRAQELGFLNTWVPDEILEMAMEEEHKSRPSRPTSSYSLKSRPQSGMAALRSGPATRQNVDALQKEEWQAVETAELTDSSDWNPLAMLAREGQG